MRLTPEQDAEIAASRSEPRPTLRATVPALEEILYKPLPVLDHGFVRVIDYMGDDAAVVQARARSARTAASSITCCAIATPRPSRCARSSIT